MDKLNICLINDSFPPIIDGVANAVKNYGTILNRELGHATVVTPEAPGADDAAFPFPVVRYPSVSIPSLDGYRAGFPFDPPILRRLEEGEYDLIHSHCPVTATMMGLSLRRRIDVPLVLTYHTKFDIEIAKNISGKLLQESATLALVKLIESCDEVWTVSRGAGENLRMLGYEGEYRVMNNGVDLSRGRASDEQIHEVTKDYDLPADVPMLLYVGRMMWYKGARITLDALAALKSVQLPFRMVFVGGGAEREEIMAYSSSLGLDDCVFFAPPEADRERLRAWYSRGDLFVFPSTFDTNGLVVSEAAACALPSVLVRGSCAAENVTEGVNGYLIQENAASLAVVLQRLLMDPRQLKAVGEAAQRDLYLSWEDAVRAAYERYHVVIDNYRSQSSEKKRKKFESLFNDEEWF